MTALADAQTFLKNWRAKIRRADTQDNLVFGFGVHRTALNLRIRFGSQHPFKIIFALDTAPNLDALEELAIDLEATAIDASRKTKACSSYIDEFYLIAMAFGSMLFMHIAITKALVLTTEDEDERVRARVTYARLSNMARSLAHFATGVSSSMDPEQGKAAAELGQAYG